jgi:pyrroline-5-carboxylate reductase
MDSELVVVGGGKMGEALVAGALSAGWAPPEAVVVVEASAERREWLAGEGSLGRFAGVVVTGSLPERASSVLLAVKPQDAEGACRALAGRGTTRALSIAAGLGTATVEGWCPRGCAVVRAMPNMAALVGASATAVSGGRGATASDIDWAKGVLGSVGTVVEVAEHLMDAVTGVSGSGPAYLMLVAEALTEGGVLMGLPRLVARQLVSQTLLGAGRLLAATGQFPEEVRAAVTSPGGTTAAGLRRLEGGATRSAFIEAVAAATERSRALGS